MEFARCFIGVLGLDLWPRVCCRQTGFGKREKRRAKLRLIGWNLGANFRQIALNFGSIFGQIVAQVAPIGCS